MRTRAWSIGILAILAALPRIGWAAGAADGVNRIRISCTFEGQAVPPPSSLAFVLPDGRRFEATVADGLFQIPPEALVEDVTMEFVVGGARARFEHISLVGGAPRDDERVEWRVGFLRAPYDEEHAYAVPKDAGAAAIWYIDFLSSKYEENSLILLLRPTDPDFPKATPAK
ncbi:hypothetical protein LLG88_08305 [bacterium]|nr:hypothetical protein [bacterium]